MRNRTSQQVAATAGASPLLAGRPLAGARVLSATLLLSGALGACKGDDTGGKGAGSLPPEDTDDGSDDTGLPFFPVDTAEGDTGFNLEPVNTLTLQHTGVWSQSPVGGPYTALTGDLTIFEYLDEDEEQPWCRAHFAVTGLKTDETCPTCEIGYLVEFYVVSEGPTEEEAAEDIEVGGLSMCESPDLPEDLERWHMGWSEDEQTLYFNYYDSGFWLPWYEADAVHDDIAFTWEETLGFFIPEEDD
jgi:hypothetical protein